MKDNLEIASRVNEKRRWLLLDTITELYTIPQRDRIALSRTGSSRPATRQGSPGRPVRTAEEKMRDHKAALLGNLLDAVSRWREREDNRKACLQGGEEEDAEAAATEEAVVATEAKEAVAEEAAHES